METPFSIKRVPTTGFANTKTKTKFALKIVAFNKNKKRLKFQNTTTSFPFGRLFVCLCIFSD